MARSNYIYLAFNKRDFTVCGAWTVKYEMFDCIGDSDDYYLFRVPDGELNPKVTKVDNPKISSNAIGTNERGN